MMKNLIVVIMMAVMCLSCSACRQTVQADYSDAILGTWYAVEYESEYVEFREDGTVADTFGSSTTYGDYIVDNENALIWVNFGDDVFSMQICDEDGSLTLLDNNGTLVREEDCAQARAEYQAESERKK